MKKKYRRIRFFPFIFLTTLNKGIQSKTDNEDLSDGNMKESFAGLVTKSDSKIKL